MIRISKPIAGPASLDAGQARTQADCALYDSDPDSYRLGSKKFQFSSSIYGSQVVKNALKAAQDRKCCYCEAIFDASYAGDVDHFRPKGAVGAGKSRIMPGYYWLAYSWSNLYYACADCNQYRKRAAFPLADENARARDHRANLNLEDPLILDPGGAKDPRDHIRFSFDVPSGTTAEGRATVDRIRLDREALCLSRRRHFKALDGVLDAVRLLRDDPRPEAINAVRDARGYLLDCLKKEGVFSAATQDYLVKHRDLWDVPQV